MNAVDDEKPRRADGAPWRNFYGRRHGKALRPRQRSLLETRLDALAPPGVDWAENPERAPIDLAALFPGARDVWLEIGFGGGEHLIATAVAHPDVGIIGCEPFVNGVAMFLAALETAGAGNVRVHAGDARFLFDVLPDACLGRVYLLYPDPWPKNRHVDRRFVNAQNLAEIARLLRPGGEFRLATDIPAYVAHSLKRVTESGAFERVDVDPATPWEGWPGTRYEAKALREGRRPAYRRFIRR
ncbi:MAG: tRNA (guanosine(46)-N7)-methyltransferase TrmB [Rhodobacteraceae bacterium]|nr:MAG: tRNA (guanosine(46)-N7)-methyltransferase TrmB [Paracoccaceae bacterium]